MKRKFLISAIGAVVVVLVMSILLSRPASEGHLTVGASIAHAAAEGKMGCATCHTSPIVSANCTSCHPSPPTRITDAQIYIPHHDPAKAPGGITCQNCHLTSGNDARFVRTPDASHNFCSTCHGPKHSSIST